MAHEFEGSDTMFSVGETPWHKLGKVVDKAPTTEEAIRLANLDWEVEKQIVRLPSGAEVPGKLAQAVVRKTDGRVLGVVGPRWQPFQNEQAFAWFDPILAAGEASLETAGSLRDGARVWILAKIGHNGDSHADIIPGDTIKNHWLMANGHDGTLAIHVGRVRTRVVCANTLRSALDEGKTIRVKHYKGAKDVLDAALDTMRAEHDLFKRDVEAYRALTKVSVTSAKLKEYVRAVFPKSFKEKTVDKSGPVYVPPKGVSLIDDVLGATERAKEDYSAQLEELGSEVYDRVVELVESGRGASIPGVRGTAWGAYNAVAEFLQYDAGRGERGATAKRMDSIAFGAAATWNGLALQKAMDLGRMGA